MLCATCQAEMLEISFHFPDGEYSLMQCPHQHPTAWAHNGQRVPLVDLLASTASAWGGTLPQRQRVRETKRHHDRPRKKVTARHAAPTATPAPDPPVVRG